MNAPVTTVTRDTTGFSKLEALFRNVSFLFLVTLLVFLVSGACGLLYQVVWTRKLVLLFGTTAYAVSTVLSIFFLGLGIGSWWGGRFADRTARPLLWYGVFEVIIGIWAILFIVFLGVGEALVVEALKIIGPSRTLAVVFRALFAGLFLLVPVTLMGATLPLLARFVTTDEQVRGFRIGALYSLNTVGAVLGCAITGFVLIAALGYTRTTYIGAGLNVTVGILALALSAAHERGPLIGESIRRAAESVTPATLSRRIVYAAFALSGFCALALEVIWTRLLTVVFLGTTYAFTTMLTTVLCGIALGSAAGAVIVDGRRRRVALFGLVQLITASSCLLMLAVFPYLPDWLSEFQRDTGYAWATSVYIKFVLAFLVLFFPTFFFGMSFPLAVGAVTATRHTVGRDVGRLYSANTFGGVLGALAGGFMIIPLLGSHWGIVLLSSLLAVTGFALVAACPVLPRPGKAAITALAAASVLFSFSLTPANVSLALNQWFVPEDQQMIHFAEGVEGVVVVTAPREEHSGSGRYLWINAVQATASIEKGVKMNRFQGVLPLLFEQEPKTALFMCFGSGITAGTLALSPFERIDTVEISREVLEASPFFAVDNFNVLESPRINSIVDDGRNFLLTTDRTYDLITFEPMPLALAGVSTFYTQEYYRLCLARLAPDGLVSQWVPLHSLNDEVVRSMMATFISVFPHYTAWFINADLFLIGSPAPLTLDYEAAERRLARSPMLQQALADVYLPDLPEIFASFLLDEAGMRRYADDARIMADDRPWAEFLAPKLIYENNVAESVTALAPLRVSPIHLFKQPLDPIAAAAIERRHRAHVNDMTGLVQYYTATIGSRPDDVFRQSLKIDPNDYNARYYLSEILLARGKRDVRWDMPGEAEAQLLEAIGHAPHRADAHLALADAYYQWERLDEAIEYYERYLALGGTADRAFERSQGSNNAPSL